MHYQISLIAAAQIAWSFHPLPSLVVDSWSLFDLNDSSCIPVFGNVSNSKVLVKGDIPLPFHNISIYMKVQHGVLLFWSPRRRKSTAVSLLAINTYCTATQACDYSGLTMANGGMRAHAFQCRCYPTPCDKLVFSIWPEMARGPVEICEIEAL